MTKKEMLIELISVKKENQKKLIYCAILLGVALGAFIIDYNKL